MPAPLKTWTYYLPSGKGEGYAFIFLTNNGVFSAVSDFGNYGYIWSNTGKDDVREFFLKSDPGYFLDKFSPEQEFDGAQTLKNVRELFEKMVVDGVWGPESARSHFDTITDEFDSFDTEVQLSAWTTSIDGMEGLPRKARNVVTEALYNGDLSAQRRSHMAERFVKETLPRLASAIKSELAAERLHVVAD